MNLPTTKEVKLKKLDCRLRLAGIGAIVIAIIGFLVSVICYFSLWHYNRKVEIDNDSYDSMVYALKFMTFVFLPFFCFVIFCLGFYILCFLRKRKNLLKNDHDA
jgi:hypothetical protein